jgi:predicted DNA-binding protein
MLMETDFDSMGKYSEVTKRTTITLPAAIYESLEEWADEEGRPTANLAAYLIEQSIRIKYSERFPPRIKRVEGDLADQ